MEESKIKTTERHNGGLDFKELENYVCSIERYNLQMENLKHCVNDIYKNIKSLGYDVKTVKEIIKLRKQTVDEIEQHDEILNLYRNIFGV